MLAVIITTCINTYRKPSLAVRKSGCSGVVVVYRTRNR